MKSDTDEIEAIKNSAAFKWGMVAILQEHQSYEPDGEDRMKKYHAELERDMDAAKQNGGYFDISKWSDREKIR